MTSPATLGALLVGPSSLRTAQPEPNDAARAEELMPIDYEKMLQYTTPFRCPECGEQTFETDASLDSAASLVESE